MPPRYRSKTLLERVDQSLSSFEDLFFLRKNLIRNPVYSNSTRELKEIIDFYVSPKKPSKEVESLNEFLDKIVKRIRRKPRVERFRLERDYLHFGKIDYEEVVFIDTVERKTMRRAYDLKVVPKDVRMYTDRRKSMFFMENTKTRVENVRLIRLFVYPSPKIAAFAYCRMLDVENSVHVRYLG